MILDWFDAQEDAQADDLIRRVLSVSLEAMKQSRSTLIVLLRFMDMAISRLGWQMYDGSLAVDGDRIWFDPRHLLLQYKAERQAGPRAYLHMVLHCVFRHFDVDPSVDQAVWDLACDMAVEHTINELELDALNTARTAAQRTAIAPISRQVKQVTAEHLYRYLRQARLPRQELDALRRTFSVDDHAVWYMPGSLQPLSAVIAAAADYEQIGPADVLLPGESQGSGSGQTDREALSEFWQELGRRMRLDLESFSRQRGDKAGALMQNLRAVTREKYDYTAFLRKFAVPGEIMRVSEDEFDTIFYTYGMRLFPDRRMPLIEPLEYREAHLIREFVIAIDTSGSVSGELVQRFVQKTYNIMKSTDSFFSHINLRIIQCDAAVQEDVKITCQREFDEYIQRMRIHGLGGTDFRPVFRRVDELIAQKEFANLKGLIYFTDGFGLFPERAPQYRAAFVFVNEEGEVPDVPSWAIKLVLKPEEI